jgi:hypothetical protein
MFDSSCGKRGGRQRHIKDRTPPEFAFDPNATAMRFHDLAHDRESKLGTLLVGGACETRLSSFSASIVRHAERKCWRFRQLDGGKKAQTTNFGCYALGVGFKPGAIHAAAAEKIADTMRQALSAAVGDGIKDGAP